jgi:hypothetical protein
LGQECKVVKNYHLHKQQSFESQEQVTSSNQLVSIADEVRKLAKLKEEGIITEEEFQQMKEDLIRNNK